MVHASKEDAILKWLVKYDSNLLLMHHRFPTSTINVKRAAHPFSTKKYFGKTEYILVHNGHISNSDDLFCDHQELGINYHSLLQDLTFNDSEALLWDFALYMEGQQKELTARGGIAFICLKLVKGKLEKMYFARNTSPLKMLRTKEGISLASELEGGEDIDSNTLYAWNYKLKRLTSRKLTIPSYAYTKNYQPSTTIGFKPGSYGQNSYAYDSCNCVDVGWEDCNYHGLLYGDDDWRADKSWNWRAENDERLGERVGNVLRRKFGSKFGLKDLPDVEYEHDPKTQLMLPVPKSAPPLSEDLETALERAKQRRQSQDRLIDDNPITDDEVTTEYMAYLGGVKGHFEQAYWALEVDYECVQALPATKKNIRAMRVIEKVMERIDSDPEYVNEESVSNIWRTLWQTTQK